MEIKKEKIKDFCVLMIEGRIDTTNFNQFEIKLIFYLTVEKRILYLIVKD
jgi:anti-anti-sigma regulatory factor